MKSKLRIHFSISIVIHPSHETDSKNMKIRIFFGLFEMSVAVIGY